MHFRKEYAFLSNMYNSPFIAHGITYKTVEHYYQSFKAAYYKDKILIINATTPTAAKALGKNCIRQENWSIEMMFAVMRAGIKYKFNNHISLQLKLLDIHEPIVENNTWNDSFWGIVDGYGLNYLGKILEEYKLNLKLHMEMDKFKEHGLAQFKYNSGWGALLCDNCKVVIKTGCQYTEKEKSAVRGEFLLEKQLCKKCKEELNGT